jgi:CheY-like chemotaxis protein/glycine cleavage system H lipoate-binding protein
MKTVRDILVIDDEPVVLQGLARICGSEGLSVDTAASGRAGLECLDKAAYRLILCDIMMGDLDGFEFLAEAQRRGNRAPVVMATGNATVQNAVRSLRCGAMDYLCKPFTLDEVMAVLKRGLRCQALLAGASEAPVELRSCPAQFARLGSVSWAATEPVGTVLIGVSDLFVKTVNGIQGLELLAPGTELVQGTGCATIRAADGLAHEVLCPVTGQVLEAHSEVVAQPATLETDPYGAGWLYRVLPSDLEYSLRNLTPRSDASDPRKSPTKGEPP